MKHTDEESLYSVLEKPFEEGWDEYEDSPVCMLYRIVLEIIEPFSTFLEVGPGLGDFSLYLLSQNKDVEMLDIKEEDLKIMKRICSEKGYNYVFHLQDITLTSLTKTYDVVFSVEVIEHIEDYRRAINNMIGLAKRKVVLTTPVLSDFSSPDHKHFFLEENFEFIDKPYKISRIITKNIDLSTGRRVFLIEIDV